MLLCGCGSLPLDASGSLPAGGIAAADYVREYCGRNERERTALTEGMRRALWPDAQVIIVCDH